MTNHWIEVDGDVIDAIKNAAEPFVDNPNRVLRRLLGLPAIDNDRTAAVPSSIPRVPRGSILPMPEFEVPILFAISEAGGSAARSAVIDAVGVALEDRLTDLDRERLRSGRLRWQSRVDHVRNELAKRGLLESDQPGVWKLTEAGIEYLDRRLKSKAAAAEQRAAQ
jgi:hypothetical protein